MSVPGSARHWLALISALVQVIRERLAVVVTAFGRIVGILA